MKILGTSLAFLIAIQLGGTFAAAEPGAGERPGREEMREKIMERFDADGDGELNEEERAEARKARREMFGREGRGPGDKAKAARNRGQGKAEGQRKGRGRGPAAEGQRGGRRGPGQGGPDGPGARDPGEIFDRIDADGDGQISREEFLEHARTMRQMRGARDRQGPGGRGERGRRGEGEFDSERFRPNFNRDGDGDRRPPRARRGGPEGDRGEFRGRGRGFEPPGPPGPPRFGRGREEGRPGPPEFRRGSRRGGEDSGPPRPERRRRGRPAPEKEDSEADDSDETTSFIEESADDTKDVDTV